MAENVSAPGTLEREAGPRTVRRARLPLAFDRVRSWFQLRVRLGWKYRATAIGLLLGGVEVATRWWQLPQAAVAVAGATSAVLIAVEVWGRVQEHRSVVFERERALPYDEILDLPADAEPIQASGEYGVILRGATEILRSSEVPVLDVKDYSLPAELTPWRDAFLIRSAKESSIFNRTTVGLASDVARDGVVLQESSYFDYLSSNDLARFRAGRRGDPAYRAGWRLYVDRFSRLRGFADSWLANGIGVSTLAITRDGKLVVQVQSGRNHSSKSAAAPSGSGGLEPIDVVGTLNDAAIRGANRELCEEVGVRPDEIDTSILLGFWRWVSKGAKPEFSSLTLLNADSHELARRPLPRQGRVYVSERRFTRLAPMAGWDAQKPLRIIDPHEATTASLPLVVSLALLADRAAAADGDRVFTELRARLAR